MNCTSCLKPLAPYASATELYSVEALAELSTRQFGKVLCVTCIRLTLPEKKKVKRG